MSERKRQPARRPWETLRPWENVLRNPCAACGMPLPAGTFERSDLHPGRLVHRHCPDQIEIAMNEANPEIQERTQA